MTATDGVLFLGVGVTAAVSGALGMGGGMLLMGLLGQLLPPASALALHGVTQLASNGFRAALAWRQVEVRVLAPYAAGALLAAGLFSLADYRPSTRLLFFLLGLLPWVSAWLPEGWTIDPARPRTAATCGAWIGSAHLLAGVSGPLLDVFFLRSPLDRRGVVATKAATQTLAHALKLAYFAGLTEGAAVLTGPRVAGVCAAAFLGTLLGRRVLEHLGERQFRQAGAAVVRVAGGLYLLRALAG